MLPLLRRWGAGGAAGAERDAAVAGFSFCTWRKIVEGLLMLVLLALE